MGTTSWRGQIDRALTAIDRIGYSKYVAKQEQDWRPCEAVAGLFSHGYRNTVFDRAVTFTYWLREQYPTVRLFRDVDHEMTAEFLGEKAETCTPDTVRTLLATLKKLQEGLYDTYIKLVFLRARYYSPETARFLSKDTWRGDYTRPQSLNGWDYVEGNPVNFGDPSGHIKESEATEADAWRENLSFLYGIQIDRDYGNTCLFNSGQCVWHNGAWRSVDELKLVSKAVNHISANTMGMNINKYRSVFGTVRIARRESTWETTPVTEPPGLAWLLGADVILPNYTFDNGDDYGMYAIIHEFGHVWDFKEDQQLSRGMELALGTSYCYKAIGLFSRCICQFDIRAGKETPPGDPNRPGGPYAGENPREDWAEAFANYVYPDYYQGLHNDPLRPLRRQYVEDQIKSIP